MHLPTRAGPRRRTWRALLAAALPAALAAIALPAAAHAATVELGTDGTLKYRAAAGETNAPIVSESGGSVAVQDKAGVSSRTPVCAQVSSVKVNCAIGSRLSEVLLGDGNDSASIRVASPLVLDGGSGDDLFFAGMAPSASRVEYRGSLGSDTVTYASASAGAVMLQDELANDGRPTRGDRDNVRRDIERFTGSPFSDRLEGSRTGIVHCLVGCSGSTAFQRFSGGLGDDTLRGGTNSAEFFMGGSPDGADTILPGSDFSIVDYSANSRPVTVTVGHGTRNDGPAGDGDDIGAGVDHLIGGRGDDALTQNPASDASISLVGGQGVDTLAGGRGNDGLDGGPGGDTLLGREGNDFIFARDGESDTVACGEGTDDTAQLDAGLDGFSSCENRPVGVLRLAPGTVRAEAGKPVKLRLSWRHPKGWQQLRTIELRLTDAGAPVGTITIRPRRERITDDGAVRLVRRATRLTHKGKTVTARLALRLDESLTGQTLKAEVEATDRRGARQLERDAASIRVAR